MLFVCKEGLYQSWINMNDSNQERNQENLNSNPRATEGLL
jgi:hypothetical protein